MYRNLGTNVSHRVFQLWWNWLNVLAKELSKQETILCLVENQARKEEIEKKNKIKKPLNRIHVRIDTEITERGSKYRSLKRSCVKCRKEICIPSRRLCLETGEVAC